jgi:hypothetical protein
VEEKALLPDPFEQGGSERTGLLWFLELVEKWCE